MRCDRHPTDGRTRLATITDAGRDVVERATAALNGEVFFALGLAADEAAHLCASSRRSAAPPATSPEMFPFGHLTTTLA